MLPLRQKVKRPGDDFAEFTSHKHAAQRVGGFSLSAFVVCVKGIVIERRQMVDDEGERYLLLPFVRFAAFQCLDGKHASLGSFGCVGRGGESRQRARFRQLRGPIFQA